MASVAEANEVDNGGGVGVGGGDGIGVSVDGGVCVSVGVSVVGGVSVSGIAQWVLLTLESPHPHRGAHNHPQTPRTSSFT